MITNTDIGPEDPPCKVVYPMYPNGRKRNIVRNRDYSDKKFTSTCECIEFIDVNFTRCSFGKEKYTFKNCTFSECFINNTNKEFNKCFFLAK